jgi:hypothetical protein
MTPSEWGLLFAAAATLASGNYILRRNTPHTQTSYGKTKALAGLCALCRGGFHPLSVLRTVLNSTDPRPFSQVALPGVVGLLESRSWFFATFGQRIRAQSNEKQEQQWH